jgi:hypothetical protein
MLPARENPVIEAVEQAAPVVPTIVHADAASKAINLTERFAEEASLQRTAPTSVIDEPGTIPRHVDPVEEAVPAEPPRPQESQPRQEQIEAAPQVEADSGVPSVPAGEKPLVREERAVFEVETAPPAARDSGVPPVATGEESLVLREPRGFELQAPGPVEQPAQRLMIDDGSRAQEPRESSGPRVHIGTIEVRTVIPKPAPGSAPSAEAVRTSVQPRPTAPLARGLAWSYGIVQG